MVADIKERICNYLESKYLAGHSNFEDTINVASFLNPRFKAQHLGDELLLIKHHVIWEGVELLGSQGLDEDVKTPETDSISKEIAPQNKRHKLSSWLKEATQVVSTLVTQQTAEQKVNSQVEDYVKCNISDPETNPLNGGQYMKLIFQLYQN